MAFPLTPTDLPAWHMPDVASWLGFRAARTQQMRAVEFPRLTLVQVVQGYAKHEEKVLDKNSLMYYICFCCPLTLHFPFSKS